MRIVSLVPSWSETLFALGAGSSVVGVTRYCVRPEETATCTIVGGTKDVDLEIVDELAPDLTILCREENSREDAHYLMGRYNTFLSSASSIAEVVMDIKILAEKIGKVREGKKLASRIETSAVSARGITEGSFACLIWNEPLMAVGGKRYPSSLLTHFGLKNVFQDQDGYPTTTLDALQTLSPDLIILPDEPYPWKRENHADLFKELQGRKIFCQGDLITWHGYRTLLALEQLPGLLTKKS